MEEHLPQSYFDEQFVMNLVDLFEEIDVNGDGGMEWDVCFALLADLSGVYCFPLLDVRPMKEFTSFIIESSMAIKNDAKHHKTVFFFLLSGRYDAFIVCLLFLPDGQFHHVVDMELNDVIPRMRYIEPLRKIMCSEQHTNNLIIVDAVVCLCSLC
jgi:hypothetical protein